MSGRWPLGGGAAGISQRSARRRLRGTLLVLESLAIVMGVVSSYWVAYGCQDIDSEASFRVPFGLQMVSAGIIGTMIHCFPYSPRWLVLVERDEDALESLARLRRLPATDSRVVTEWRGILAEIQFQKIMAEKAHPGKQGLVLELLQWADLFRKKTWRRTVVGVGVAFFQQCRSRFLSLRLWTPLLTDSQSRVSMRQSS